MDRRQFVKASVAGGAVLGLAAGGVWLAVDGEHCQRPVSFAQAIELLQTLSSKKLAATGQWDVAQIFNHCAQSVEYSMQGFPEHKPEWFKSTAGSAAFALFDRKDCMLHNLAEPIPGADVLSTGQSTQAALQRLIEAMAAFDQFSQPTAPHFAYGALSKSEYAKAHVMHLNQHLNEIKLA